MLSPTIDPDGCTPDQHVDHDNDPRTTTARTLGALDRCRTQLVKLESALVVRQNQPDTDPAFFMPKSNSSGITGLHCFRIRLPHALDARLIQVVIGVFIPMAILNDRLDPISGFHAQVKPGSRTVIRLFSCPAVRWRLPGVGASVLDKIDLRYSARESAGLLTVVKSPHSVKV